MWKLYVGAVLSLSLFLVNPVWSQSVPEGHWCSENQACAFEWNPNSEPDMDVYVFYTQPINGSAPPTSIATIPHPTTTYTTMIPLSDGVYSAWVVALDKAGNVSELSNTVIFGVDNQVPNAPINFRLIPVSP